MQQPNAPGWWAFEGRIDGYADNRQMVCNLMKLANGKLYVMTGSIYRVDAMVGKWTRIHLPWESPPAQPPAPIPDNPDGNDPLGFHNQRWVRIDWNTLVALEQTLAGNTEPGLRVFVEMLVRQANDALNTPQDGNDG